MARFLRALAHLAAPHRLGAGVILTVLVLETVVNALVPLSFKVLFDRVLPRHDERLLTLVLAVLIGGVVALALGGLVRDWLYARLSSRLLADLRQRVFEHLQRLSMEYFGRTESGQITARFSTDLAAVEHALASATWGILPSLDVLLTTALLFALDWRLALVAMLIWPCCLLGPRLIAPRATAAAYDKKEAEGATLALVNEAIGAQAVIKAFGLEAIVAGQFGARNATLRERSIRVSFLSALIERSAWLGILVLQVVIVAVGARLAFEGALTIGTLAAFQALFITLGYALYNVAQYAPVLVQASGGLRRIEEVLDEVPRVADRAGAGALGRLAEGIELRNVTFAYGPDAVALRDVTLTIPRGAFVAFVGPSGSGKSTLVSLLTRFHDPSGGAVLVDGRDVRDVTQASLRAQVGVVFQDSVLFGTSLRENIRLGRPAATDAEVEAAARAAEIHDAIVALPAGYDEPAGERGGRLSGGQRQRIAIARVMVRDPALLLLDEATSALDPVTEAAINATVARLARGRTVVSVTHRLSEVVEADRVFVLDRGRVVEQGRHADLLARQGVYARLWDKQTGLLAAGDGGALRPAGLRRVRLLDQLDDATLEELTPRFTAETFGRDHVIVREGDVGDRLYIIVRGIVEATRAESAGERRLGVLEDGDFFGEIALLEGVRRMATIRTLSFCTCLSLGRDDFLRLLERIPDVRAAVTAEAARRAEQAGLI